MTKDDAIKRIDKLRSLISKYRHARLVLDEPLVDESIEDSLKKELFDLELEFPELITPDSPSQRVGGKALDEFKKVPHSTRMLSLNDAFNREDMEEWIKRLERLDPRAVDGGFFCELKLDGLAIELTYENGLLEVGSTRGDGTIGEDVTNNLRTIEDIPLNIETNTNTVVVRGEVFIYKKELERINREQVKKELPVYANPRNLAAGTIRQLDPSIPASRKLNSHAYSLISDLGQSTHEEEHSILKKLGFVTDRHTKLCTTLDEIQEFRDYWEKHRDKLHYEIDGIVVQLNDNAMFKKLGVVGKTPRAGIAYKFSPKESTTILKDIIVSVGRTGVLTPVAILEPVEIGGTTVSRATLHNEDEIERLGVKIGDTVVVGRAGDVIPDVKRAIVELRTGKEKSFRFPSRCSVCEGEVVKAGGEVAYKCVNKNCPAIKREGMYHFISRGAIDIDGVGPKVIDALMDAGLIKDSADLYFLTKEDFLNLDRFAEKSAQNAFDSIQSRKNIALDRFIFALGIPHVGSETASDLAKSFGRLDKISRASVDELNSIRDIGGVVAESIYSWFNDKHNKVLLEKFDKAGVTIKSHELSQKSQKLKGQIFVFTGSMDSMTREMAEGLVREHGGSASSSVTKTTTYLVAGESTGSKYEKAQKFGTKIISEKEFLSIINS